MKVAYGYTVTENDDFIGVAEESAMISAQALAPGRWLVDYYPIGTSTLYSSLGSDDKCPNSSLSPILATVYWVQTSRRGVEKASRFSLRSSTRMGQKTNGRCIHIRANINDTTAHQL